MASFLWLLACGWCAQAHAESLSFKIYGTSQGLRNLGGSCLLQDRAGYILTCSDHGVFAYDGRQFSNLGLVQGLRDGGVVFDASVLQDGRLAIRYPDQVFISDRPSTALTSPLRLHFEPALPAGMRFYNVQTRQMAPWRQGLALITGASLRFVSAPAANGQRRIADFPYARHESTLLDDPTGVFRVADMLWETFDGDRICRADPGHVRCWSAPAAAKLGDFEYIGAGSDGRVLARSQYAIVEIDPASAKMEIEPLPFQGGMYVAYTNKVGLFRDPRGNLVTQAADGLIIQHGSTWRHLTTRDGVPSGVISNGLTDRDNQIWLQVLGRGLFRGLDFGVWEGFQTGDGLSAGIAWEELRDKDGSLWISTDTGVDEVERINDRLRTVYTLPLSSFALALSPEGNVWTSSGRDGLSIIDRRTRGVSQLGLPAVESIAEGGQSRMWVGTDHGLFSVDTVAGKPGPATRASPDEGPVVALLNDGAGGVYFVAAGGLRHRHANGKIVAIAVDWPVVGYQPLTFLAGRKGEFWAGGAGGLFRFRIVDDRAVGITRVGEKEVGSSTIVALCFDSRGWLWIGTGAGISVYDGKRWTFVNASRGLVWDDVSQNGIYEDPDGSMWIATSQGLSHLLEPKSLFNPHPLQAVISSIELGSSPLLEHTVPFTSDPLTVNLGTVSFLAEDSVVFRYRLSGVDKSWAETSAGVIRYANVPAGKHVFTAYAVDTLTSARSKPVTFVLRVGYPWWRSDAADAGYCAALIAIVCLFVRLQVAVTRSRRSEAAALDELRRQATTDTLTGLFNRAEVERRLAETLSRQTDMPVLLALLDIDHFKRVNDEHGHLAGDIVIREMGRRVADMLDAGDYAGRYGGEELILILRDPNEEGLARIRRLQADIRDSQFRTQGKLLSITCSIGVSWSRSKDDWESLVGRADAALYTAKRNGRDRVVEDWSGKPHTDRYALVSV